MQQLWQPRAVAVVGSGPLARQAVNYLRRHEYGGRVYAVDPRSATVASITEPVDLALLLVSAGRVMDALQDCADRGVAYAIICASGFAETGQPELEAEMVAFARDNGIRIIGPNCIGLVSPPDRLVAGFSPLFARAAFEPGPLGLVAQSGALGYGITSLAVERGLAFSRIINTGNEADVDSAELVGALLQDHLTRAVLVYAEGFKRPMAWRELGALSISTRKPVIVLKAGRSAPGVRAAASHTAALAGDDAIWDAALRHLGFLRVADADEMLDLAAAVAQPRRPAGRRAGVLTTSGGAGILAADALIEQGLTLPTFTPNTRRRLEDVIPAYGSAANPADVTAQVISDSTLFRRALGALADDPEIDLLLVCFCVLQGEEAERVAADLRAVHADTDKPILVAKTGAEFLAPGLAARLTQKGIPVFETPGRAARAAGALVRFAETTSPPAAAVGLTLEPSPHPARIYTEAETKALLLRAGLPITRETLATTADAAVEAAPWLGFPVVLKIVSPDIPHKTDVGGVRLNLLDPDAVRQAYAELTATAVAAGARIHGCLVQEQVTDAVAELLVGVSPTPMGPMLTVGLGGIFVEALGDVVRRLAPVTEAEALAMIHDLKARALLTGTRGRPSGDLPALADLIARLSRWALERPGQWELDLNPVLLRPKGCVIADALLIERGSVADA